MSRVSNRFDYSIDMEVESPISGQLYDFTFYPTDEELKRMLVYVCGRQVLDKALIDLFGGIIDEDDLADLADFPEGIANGVFTDEEYREWFFEFKDLIDPQTVADIVGEQDLYEMWLEQESPVPHCEH